MSKIKVICMVCGKVTKLNFRDTRAICKKCLRDPGRSIEDPLKFNL